jgi:hypothetical protein
MDVDPQRVVDDTRRWLDRAVIGLNLCPFAKAEHVHGRIHYAASSAVAQEDLLHDLAREARELHALPGTSRETTLLIAPCCLSEFLEFNAFVQRAERWLARTGWAGVFQLASFHPDYQFAGTDPEDIGNFTNRAPYPTLHLLREDSVERAVQAMPDPEAIYGANLRTLERIGFEGWSALGVGRTR